MSQGSQFSNHVPKLAVISYIINADSEIIFRCGEFTPLVVIFFTSAVPRVIWIPKQVQKAQEEAENRRAKARMETSPFSSGPPPRPDLDSMPEPYQRGVLKFYAKSLDLYPDWWDRWVPTLMSTSLITKRVYRRLEELEVDDFAIARCGGVGKMEAEEIQMACQERYMHSGSLYPLSVQVLSHRAALENLCSKQCLATRYLFDNRIY